MHPPSLSHCSACPKKVVVSAPSKWERFYVNSISRRHMFEEARSRIPSMAAWKESCCGVQPIILLDNTTTLSQCGVQLGDLLGPLGFALMLQPIVECIKAELPALQINAWYLNDGTLCSSPNDFATAMKIVEEEAQSGAFI